MKKPTAQYKSDQSVDFIAELKSLVKRKMGGEKAIHFPEDHS
jgi:hypothetical protein